MLRAPPAGAALFALRLAYGVVRVWWMERRATELTGDGWVRPADGLSRRPRLGRIARLLRRPGHRSDGARDPAMPGVMLRCAG